MHSFRFCSPNVINAFISSGLFSKIHLLASFVAFNEMYMNVGDLVIAANVSSIVSSKLKKGHFRDFFCGNICQLIRHTSQARDKFCLRFFYQNNSQVKEAIQVRSKTHKTVKIPKLTQIHCWYFAVRQ